MVDGIMMDTDVAVMVGWCDGLYYLIGPEGLITTWGETESCPP